MHTDRGPQYASKAYRKLLAKYGMKASMSRRANYWENSVAESFFKILKIERIYRNYYHTRDQAKLDIVNWIEGFYNAYGWHSTNDNKAPNQLERELMAAQEGCTWNRGRINSTPDRVDANSLVRSPRACI